MGSQKMFFCYTKNMERRQVSGPITTRFKECLKSIKDGSFVSGVEKAKIKSKADYQALSPQKKINFHDNIIYPEREAAAQILIEEFFKSQTFSEWKNATYFSCSQKVDPQKIRNFELSFFTKSPLEISLIKHFKEFLEKSVDNFLVSRCVKILNELLIFTTPSGFSAENLIRSGLGTATDFSLKAMHLFTQFRNELHSKSVIENKSGLAKSLRNTMLTLGTLMASYRLENLKKVRVLLAFGRYSSQYDFPVILSTMLGFSKENFTGEINSGEALSPTEEIMAELLKILREQKETVRCPALTPNEKPTPLKIFLTITANMYLLSSGLLKIEEINDN
jgi:hypothetical protein